MRNTPSHFKRVSCDEQIAGEEEEMREWRLFKHANTFLVKRIKGLAVTAK